jgi:hypothetical protein
MNVHRIKEWPEHFKDLLNGRNFEVRRNDRNYQVGDVLWIKEYDPLTEEFTGRGCYRTVLRVHPSPHLENDMVILQVALWDCPYEVNGLIAKDEQGARQTPDGTGLWNDHELDGTPATAPRSALAAIQGR